MNKHNFPLGLLVETRHGASLQWLVMARLYSGWSWRVSTVVGHGASLQWLVGKIPY